jgi:predicted ATPase/transcriptional regulator with XRE-family HTH domain
MRSEPLHGSDAFDQHRNQAGMVARDLPRFGELMRRHRMASALSQEELAERAGVSARAISDLERGVHRAPRLETVRMLAAALGLGEDDRAELLAAARPAGASSGSTVRSRLSALASLPRPPTRLIGRETEVAALSALLAQDDVRLVTLTGPGGTGKTHLALEVAAGVSGRYRDGVFFVDLSALTDPDLVMQTIAATLGVRETADASLWETVSGYVRERQLLLVLDNCEQVLGAASDVAGLLAACQDLEVLATSREPLHIRAEREVAVAPLPLPDPGETPLLAALERNAAVALFVERAVAVSAGFALTADNAAAVAGICQRLDGLPLAIELAAARIKALPPAALLARLDQRLPLLTGGGRDLPARQRTMRDTIAWSYDLLSPESQALFRHLAVFPGGFTLAAAEAVVDAEAAPLVLDGIGALIEQSLLRQAPGTRGEPRYQMLETVREFGLEQLSLAGGGDVVRARHAAHFLQLSDGLVYGLQILDSLDGVRRVSVEGDNVRLALGWFDEHGETDALLRLSAMIYGVWLVRGLYREGLLWLERALERSSHVVSDARFQALDAAGTLSVTQGDYDQAARFFTEGLEIARGRGDPILVGQALTNVGFLAYRRSEYERAEALLEDAHYLVRDHADRVPDAIALLLLGETAFVQHQFDRARLRYQAALTLFQATHSAWGVGDAQAGLGAVSYCTGNAVLAATLYGESLQRAQGLGYGLLALSALLGLAAIAADAGQPENGAKLVGAADAIVASLAVPIFLRDQPVRERCLSALTAVLGEERLAAAREVGRSLTLEEAIAEAKAVGEAVVRSVP